MGSPSATHRGPCPVADLGIRFVSDRALRILARELSRRTHPEVEVLLIEPSRRDPLLFLQGPMSFQARTRILQHGDETTLGNLAENTPAHLDHAMAPCRSRARTRPPPARIRCTDVSPPLESGPRFGLHGRVAAARSTGAPRARIG